MKISVIIPVYNAEKFLENAVDSALGQPETAEVILVEDNSPDDALKVCEKLTQKHKKVRLFRHPNGENRGAGASRNLGIEKAQFDYVAFLDADDWYCKNRFLKTRQVFEKKTDADGVYDAVGIHFENKQAKDKWFQYRDFTLTAPKKRLLPEELLQAFLLDNVGHFCTDGIVIKKSAFEEVGLFDTDLKISQDTHMWIRLAAKTRLYPGDITSARAIRRVHTGNRWTTTDKKRFHFQQMYWQKLDDWARQEKLPLRKKAAIHCAYLIYKSGMTKEFISVKSVFRYAKNLSISFFHCPILTLTTIKAMSRRLKTELRK